MATIEKSSRETVDRTATYRAKRNFSRTPEPVGGSGAGYRLIVQHHFARRDHYDLRLQIGDALASWAVTRGPSANPKDRRLAVRTEDHPLDYAKFEGTIPQGEYGGGTVILWESTTYTPDNGDPAEAREKGEIKFTVHGERMKGGWVLVRMNKRGGDKHENWLLIKERDAFVETDDSLTSRYPDSVTTMRSRVEIEAGAPPKKSAGKGKGATKAKGAAKGLPTPDFVPPELCGTAPSPPATPGWLFEMKYDGYRLQAAHGREGVKIYSRAGLDWTHRFPSVVGPIRDLACRNALIDGEAVVFDDHGVTDFAALVAAIEGETSPNIVLMAFDLLTLDGKDLRKLPLVERKAKLRELIGGGQESLRYAEHVAERGAEVFEAARQAGAEGVIAKRADAPYSSGRSEAWLKIKAAKREDVVVVGFMPSERGNPFASLLAAIETQGKLAYAGRVGTGYTEALRAQLWKRMGRGARAKPPADLVNAAKLPRGAMFLAEPFRAEVRFTGWTGDGQMRQAAFLGVREDVPVKRAAAKAAAAPVAAPAVKAARAAPDIAITHADRIVYPDDGFTKGDIAAYYAAVAERMSPYLEDRLVSIIRAPDNIKAETFFQRHPTPGMKRGVLRVRVDDKVYMALDDGEGLRTAAQFGAVEFHGWMCRRDQIQQSDRLIIDLDPDPSVGFDEVKSAAFDIAERLRAIDVETWPMLSGGKGVHVVAPLDRSLTVAEVEAFAHAFAEGLADKEPARFIASMSKAKRKGRIYVDWMRNKLGSTAILPWSLRARAGAPVAVPLDWKALAKAKASNAYNLKTAPKAKDPWGPFLERKQTIPKAVMQAVR